MKYPFTKSGDSGFHFQEITVADKEFADMFTAFQIDYAKIDNLTINGEDLMLGKQLRPDLYFKVINDGKTVGFINRFPIKNESGSGYAIEDVYVKPEYRGCGVATRIYQHAIHNYQVLAMTLSWQRVNTLAQIDAYREAGFTGVMIQPGQTGGARGLCMLVTSELHTPLWFRLDKQSIVKARQHSERICKKLARKIGGGLSRHDLMSLNDEGKQFVQTVISNHFGNRMKQYLGA